MTNSEKLRTTLATLLAKGSAQNADLIAENIELMVDFRVAELMEALSDRLGKMVADAKAQS